MFKWIEQLTKPRDPDSLRYKKELALRLSGSKLRYVTRRIDRGEDNPDEEVVGRDGLMMLRGDYFCIYAGENKQDATGYNIVFKTPVSQLYGSELLSGDGIIITGRDEINGGQTRSVVAYYVYHRK